MPATFVFLLKVNIALLLFCAGYYLVLRPLTFYTLNRIYLLAAILFASIYPQINFSAFVQRHEELAKPMQQIAINWQSPAQLVSQPVTAIDYWYWLSLIFWTGAGLLLIRLVMQLFSLFRLYKTSKPQYIGDHLVRIMDKDAAPFSFWRSIYVNPAKHEPADLKAILLHEQVHVNQWHTADILLAELSSIFYWFNPGIWLIKKAVRENIEFITDQKILKNGIDSKTYQYSLVNVSFNNSQPSIVNHFNISTIKKRIIMMNAKRSSKLNLTRYAFVVPAVVALLLVFSISKADIAKPMRLTLVKAVQPLARIININADDIVTPPAKAPKAPKAAHKTPAPKAVTTPEPTAEAKPALTPMVSIAPIAAAKVDTSKKIRLVFVGAKKDSLVFVVNGVKADVKKVDPNNIENVSILSGEDAEPFITPVPGVNINVAYVVTKDAPNKEELKKKYGTKRITINRAMVARGSGDLANVNDDNNISTAVVVSDNVNVNPDVKTTVTVRKNGSIASSSSNSTVTINGVKAKSASKTFSIASDDIIVGNGGDVMVTGYGKAANIKAINVNGMKIVTSGGKDPLILIDGKTSSTEALKKLDPDKIESMSILKGDDANKKYGDKAKDGVIIINTRKK